MFKRINKKLAISKGLITGDNYDLYSNVANAYKSIFEQILLSKVNLKNYDSLIEKSNLDFGISNPRKEQLCTNLSEYLNCKYIYLINNFFVEKLSLDSIELFKKYINKENVDNNNLLTIVKSTYKEVLKDNYRRNGYSNEKYKVCYGSFIPSNCVNNDSLVLKIVYSRNTKQLSDDDYIRNMREKGEFLDSIVKDISVDLKNNMNVDCDVIVEKLPN